MAMWFLGLMSNPLKTWHVDQIMLLLPSVQGLVPEGHLAHFVQDTVRDSRDLSAIVDAYTEHRGFPPYDPTMMTALLMCATAKSSTRRGGSQRRVRRGWTSCW